MFAYLVAATGWTWDVVGELTLPRLRALNKHWDDFPPVHIGLARLCNAYLEKPKSAPAKGEKPKGMEDFIRDYMGAAGGGIAGV